MSENEDLIKEIEEYRTKEQATRTPFEKYEDEYCCGNNKNPKEACISKQYCFNTSDRNVLNNRIFKCLTVRKYNELKSKGE